MMRTAPAAAHAGGDARRKERAMPIDTLIEADQEALERDAAAARAETGAAVAQS
jgi:hypothetical protein